MFTTTQIKNLKPKAKPYRVYERGADRGFHVQVSPGGKISFGMAYMMAGKKRFYKLGAYSSAFGLAQAREDCRVARALVDRGIDPQLERASRLHVQENERELESRALTVNQVLDRYLSTLTNSNTRKNVEQQFHSDVRSFIGKSKLIDLSEYDLSAVIQRVVDRGAVTSARNLYIAMNAAFNQAKKSSLIRGSSFTNPLEQIEKPVSRNLSDRALTVNQIREYWHMLDTYKGIGNSIKDALRLILLTGQRVQEIVGLRWSEVDLELAVIDIPPDRIKTGKKTQRGHIVPITPMMASILSRQPKIGSAVFPGRNNPDIPLSWQSLTKAVSRMLSEESDFPLFSPRDSRRTVKTHMARIKILKEVRDRIQNHAFSDVASTHYDRYDYLDEKREGLERWERELQRIIGLENKAINKIFEGDLGNAETENSSARAY